MINGMYLLPAPKEAEYNIPLRSPYDEVSQNQIKSMILTFMLIHVLHENIEGKND